MEKKGNSILFRNLKRILSSFLIICMLLMMVPTWTLESFAAISGTCGTNLKWTYSEGTLKISGSGSMENYQYGGVPWWDLQDETTTIIVEASVTSIGNNAFYNFSSLKNVQLSEGITTIGNYAFAHCTNLAALSLPASVDSIGDCAFRYCTKLQQIEVFSGSTSYCDVNGVLFDKNIRKLQCYPAGKTGSTYVIPESVTIVEREAFAFCENLTSITLPSRLTTIKNGAFWCCENWSDIKLPSTVTSIGDSAFGHCYKLTGVKIPSVTTTIGYGAFIHCSGITEVDLSCGISRISGDTFAGCSSLKSVIIPKGVTSVSGNAFSGCNSLTHVYFEGSSVSWGNVEMSYGNESLTNSSITYNYKESGNADTQRVYGQGYNPVLDRYHFRNIEDKVSEDIYKDIYGNEKGKLAYKEREKNLFGHGLCYGMAVTTASLWLDRPAVNTFHRWEGSCVNISDINPGSVNSTLNLITAKTFIKYGYATQFSTQSLNNYRYSCEAVYNAVYDYVYRGGSPVTIALYSETYDDVAKKWETDFAHEILAVGLEGNNKIIVDDSNCEELKTIALERNNSGEFTGKWSYPDYPELVNGDNAISEQDAISQKRQSIIGCAIGSHVILADLVLEYEGQLDYVPVNLPENEKNMAICDFEPIDQEYNLCCVKADTYDLNGIQEVIPVKEPQMGTFNRDTGNDLFWVSNDESIIVNEVTGQNNEIIVAGNDISISASVSESDSVAVTLDEKDNDVSVNIDSQSGEDYKIVFESTSEDQEEILLLIEGTANGETVEAVQTSTGIVVNGLTEAEVKLSYDENIVQEEKVSELKGDINIIYDKDDSDKKVVVEYEKIEVLTGNVDIEGELVSGSEVKVIVTECNNTGIMYYQWYADDTAIENATDANYILTDNEVGHRMKVVVSSSEQSGTIECETTEIVKEKDDSLATVLPEAKEAAKKEVAEYKNADDYRDEEKAELAAIINKANEAIDAAETVEAVTKIVEVAKGEMDAVPVIPEIILADKTALAMAIETAKAVDGTLYTEESYAAIKEKIAEAEAVYTKEDATQAEINAAETALNNAVKALEELKNNEVIRIAGDRRIDTAFVVADTLKETLGLEKFEAVIIARSKGIPNKEGKDTGFADALAGSYLAYVEEAPILLISDARMDDVVDYVKANLAENGKVYILGGTSAVSASLEDKLAGYTVDRLAGANRYETNLMVLDRANVTGGEIIVSTGKNFADSLSASAAKLPILMVKEGLTEAQKEFLEAADAEKLYIVGENEAVSGGVEVELKTYADVERIAGGTRRETSVKIAEKFFNTPEKAMIASASDYPDGLCGGPLAAALDAPLLLTVNEKTSEAATYMADHGIKAGCVLGGAAVMTDKTVVEVFALEGIEEIK